MKKLSDLIKQQKPKSLFTNGRKEIAIYTGIEKGKVWLEIESGEGADFPEEDIYKVLRGYFEENF